MNFMEQILAKSKNILISVSVIIFPFFFLPLTQEYFLTNKLYLVTLISLLLIVITLLQLGFNKKINLTFKELDVPIVFFLIALFVSVMATSANKVAGLLTINFGFIAFFALTILYFYLSRSKKLGDILKYFPLISAVLSFITVIFFFNPGAKINFSYDWLFLKNSNFTTLGSQLDLSIFLGFFLIYNVINTATSVKTSTRTAKQLMFDGGLIVFNLLALILTIYKLTMPSDQIANQSQLILPPWNLSWLTALEVLKNIKTGFFGIGIGGFSVLFSHVKDVSYNQSFLWQVNSFNAARSTFLHVFAETGVLGFAAFCLIVGMASKKLLSALKETNVHTDLVLLISFFVYLFVCLFFFPPSFSVFFLLFVVLALISEKDTSVTNVAPAIDSPIFYIGFSAVMIIVVGVAMFFLGRGYVAEYYFQKSIQGIAKNDARIAYDYMRKARSANPYEERYIINFSQVNLLIAENIARKPADKITSQDRQTIAQAVQAAISEGKELIKLNPQKAQYWENLALVYKNIITIAKGADVWAISSYQRAIVLDPTNPNYALNLGGIYYLLGQYDQSTKMFQQSLADKPNWPNAYYNLAWSYYQSKEYDKAVNAMEATISLLDAKASAADWQKARSDLDSFKKQLTEAKQPVKTGDLNLPEKPVPDLKPKLDLPKDASPTAR